MISVSMASVERMLDLKWLKKTWLSLSAVVLLFIPFDLLSVSQKGKQPVAPEKIASPHKAERLRLTPTEPLSAYESVAKWFASEDSSPSGSPFVTGVIEDYRLKGIVILNQPEAILEDVKTQRTVFVKAGDQVGGLRVKEIREGSVVFLASGEEKELRIQ